MKKRTVLFQEVNKEVLDLLTLIGETGDKLSLEDDVIWEIREKLDIYSEKQYLNTFHPAIYQYLDTEKQTVAYYPEKRAAGDVEKQIVLTEDYWLIHFLYDVLEGRDGRKNQMNPFWNIFEYRYPIEKVLAFTGLRIQWKKLWLDQERDTLEEQKKLLAQIQQEFDDGSFLLYYYIQDKQKHIGIQKAYKRQRIHIEKTKDSEAERIGYTKEPMEEDILSYEETKRWEQHLFTLFQKSELVNRTLLCKCLIGKTDCAMHEEEEIIRYNQYASFYGQVAEQFTKAVLPMIKNFIQVYFFFHEQTEDLQKTLLVTNCQLEKFVQPSYQKRLQVYLESVNEKAYSEERIGSAILPMVKTATEPVHLTRERFAGTRQKDGDGEEKVQTLNRLKEILNRYQVEALVKTEEEAQRGGYTIIPEQMACIQIARRAYMQDDGRITLTEHNSVKIWFGTIFVESTYLTAGRE